LNLFHKGFVYPLNRVNVDTDQIIPKQFLKRIERSGFGQFLFYDWRYDEKGNLRKSFSLNDAKYKDASILVTGNNFGCGSSREHAPWALKDFGFQIIIAPSFADIFYNNSVKNGIVPVKLTEKEVDILLAYTETTFSEIAVDLENQQLYGPNGFKAHFEISSYQKEMLLNGWDEISLTLVYEDKIKQFEQNYHVS
jgi:3-isopropylmalate/(R)-2-methylmalate dehydratase small subunit